MHVGRSGAGGRCALAAVVCGLAGCAGGAAQGRGVAADTPPSSASPAGIAAWREAPVEALPPEAFVPLDRPRALGPVRDDLGVWWDRFFRPEASPRRAETARLGVRIAGGGPDMVRSEYEMAVARLEVIDTALHTLVRVSDPGVDVADGAAAQVIVRRVLAVGPDRTWNMRFPDRLAEGEWYASAPGVEVEAMRSFRDRIGVRVRGGRLELLCYKRGEGERPDPARWFPSELRARLAPSFAPAQ
jgi:hypothetical protein